MYAVASDMFISVHRRTRGILMATRPRPVMERMMEKVRVDPSGCWVWTGPVNHGGYGRIYDGERYESTHRASYAANVGPIPAGMQLDHLCRNRACCNPEHLEPVTPQVNQLRGTGFSARNAAKTHCPKGHEYNEQNTYVPPGRRVRMCRLCTARRSAAHSEVVKARLRAATAAALAGVTCQWCDGPMPGIKRNTAKWCTPGCGRRGRRASKKAYLGRQIATTRAAEALER